MQFKTHDIVPSLALQNTEDQRTLTLNPKYATSPNEAWGTLSMTDYKKGDDWSPSLITHSKMNDLEPPVIGFFASSEDTVNYKRKIHKKEYDNSKVTQQLKVLTPIFPLIFRPSRLGDSVSDTVCSHSF